MNNSNDTPDAEAKGNERKSLFKDPKVLLEKSRDDWKKLETGFKDLKEKMEQEIFKNMEKFENLKYQNIKNADAIKGKIKQDWEAFELEVETSLNSIKSENEKKNAEFIQNLNSKRDMFDSQLKQWESNYQEWSSTTKKNLKTAITTWSMAGWRAYISFLIVVVPIVIIIVVLANAFRS